MQIDVMMPAFNAARTIASSIASLQRQTHGDIRILVVDDGSTDATPEILSALAQDDPRVVVCRQTNLGTVGARNAALRQTATAYVAQLDADDLSDPDHIARLAAHLDAHSGCVAVSGAARQIDADGRPLDTVSRFGPPAAADPTLAPAREPVMMPFCLWRRDALDAVGGYREVGTGQDSDLAWRLLARGEVTNLDEIVGSYRVHDSSTGTSLVNGRVFAVCTQVVALSARRRERNLPDLVFAAEASRALRSAKTLDGMLDVRIPDLEPDEVDPLRLRVAAKMLQWCEWRGRLPDRADLRFMRRAFARQRPSSVRSRREVRRLRAVIGARLLRNGQFADALMLLPRSLLPEAGARTVLGRF